MKGTLFCKSVLSVSIFLMVAALVSTQVWGQCVENDTGALDIMEACPENGTITHTVRVQNAPNDVDAMGFDITYDPAILTYTGEWRRGACVSGFLLFDCTPQGEGAVRCGGIATSPETMISTGDSCDVVELDFTVKEQSCSSLDLENLVDDLVGWSTSNGCSLCDCCDPVPEVCDDGIDNDCDDLVDCDDPNCADFCCEPVPEVCDDGIDNDCDDLVDCDDPNCEGVPPCPPVGECVEDVSGSLDVVGAPCDEVGATITHTVRVQNAPNDVDAMGFDVAYDPAILTYTGDWRRGECVTGFLLFDCTPQGDGAVRCGGIATSPETMIPEGASCDVVELDFTVKEQSCSSVGLENLVDDLVGWSTSNGCFDCNCEIICNPEVCDDGIDNDCDGLVDCADPDCCDVPPCPSCECEGDGCMEVDPATLSITSERGAEGSIVSHVVKIQNAPNEVKNFGFEISYPDCALEYVDYIPDTCVEGWTFFQCSNPEPGRIKCGGTTIGSDFINPGETCDIVGLQFTVMKDPCELDMCWTVDFIDGSLVNQIVGWPTSHGCFCCGCLCDIDEDGVVTPQDANCSLEMSIDRCPTEFCGPCEGLCCDVSGLYGTTPADGQCTPADALCRFMEYLEMRPNCCTL